ncbi:4-hydroxy-4-methyl-2-oxoglutarate aldolase [Paenarthrobacter nicotinovorans]|uniref:RraA family protein n=1 Tax=Paenarthrobacter nicotinovorans TaxID=29320 RepID=UPI00278286AB|nr:RraA family protein [Paenarthrobacter nicotinovorans]MDP9936786.1 4-hydroxy-4-methyl-2-oxoglutarate aldolase [Paenarthrobacter nicotinovorans]
MTNAARGHSSATLYEASKLPCACDPGIKPAWRGAKVAGPAFTVRGVGGDNLALHHAVLNAPAGSVLVVDMQGAEHGHWGEILAAAAQHRGIAGLVIDGGVRDTDEMAEMDFPVFSRSVTVVGTAKDYAGDFSSPVRVGGLTVRAGDLVVGDADGVVVLPRDAADTVLDKADQRVADEHRILAEIRAGKSTLELYSL